MIEPEASTTGAGRRSLVPGLLLIVFGLLFLASNLMDFRVANVWPLALLVPSLVFFVMALRDRRQYGLLMPATILFVISGIFFACEVWGWELMGTIWPLFILAPGLGFFVMYLFGKRENGLLVPAGILSAIGVIFLMQQTGHAAFWPILLIALGLILLFSRRSTPPAPPAPPDAPQGS